MLTKQWDPVAAVHWPSNRLAVPGVANGLRLFSTNGELLQAMVDDVSRLVQGLKFSPDGKKLAAFIDAGIQFFELN